MVTVAVSASRSGAASGRRARRPGMALHGLLVGLTVLVCLVLPRAGEAVLLVPLGGGEAGARLSGTGVPPLAVIGRGWLPGSLVVHPGGPLPLWLLVRGGIVPVAVPMTVCGGAGASRNAPIANPLNTRG